MAKRKAAESPNWHPDFRDLKSLPDIKVVRTDFLVNFLALTIPIILLFMVGYRQFRTMDFNSQIEDIELLIQNEEATNNKNLKGSKSFLKEAETIEDLEVFFGPDLEEPVLDVLVAFTESLPENIALSEVRFSKGTQVISKKKSEVYGVYELRGVLKGSSSEALSALNSYREVLEGLNVFEGRLDNIEESAPRRNTSLGLFEFSMDIRLKGHPTS